jgi:hypothetical protein
VALTVAGLAQSAKKQLVIPDVVKQAFIQKFPNTTAKWSKEGEEAYEASFKNGGQEMSVVFEKDGMITETETEIKKSELPAGVIEYIKANYQGSAIKETAKITKASGEVNYEAEVNGKDLIFDASGKFLKEVKD